MKREIHNPFKQEREMQKQELATASANAAQEKELATASALSNMRPDICPKCGSKMGKAFLYNKREVYYCAPCRVSHPKE